MYSSNLFNLSDEFWDKEGDAGLVLNQDDDIIQGCLITHQGEIVNETIKSHYQQ
jgi:NAD(P) transhydrogenase subunit alpha